MDALLIINRRAGQEPADLEPALDRLVQAGWRLRREQPAGADDMQGLIRHWGPRVDRILIGGGDGTLNRAAEALLEVDRPLGILPLGTANDLARTLTIPADICAAAEVIREDKRQRIDLGRVNGKFFFNGAHLGLGEKVITHLNPADKRQWGIWAYLKSFFSAYQVNQPFTVDLTCDGSRERFTSIEVTVANGRHYGGGMTVIEDAAIDDHRLNLTSLKPQSLVELAALALALRQGRIRDRQKVLFRSGEELEIKTAKQMTVTTDGEPTTHSPARFQIVRAALEVAVPADFTGNP